MGIIHVRRLRDLGQSWEITVERNRHVDRPLNTGAFLPILSVLGEGWSDCLVLRKYFRCYSEHGMRGGRGKRPRMNVPHLWTVDGRTRRIVALIEEVRSGLRCELPLENRESIGASRIGWEAVDHRAELLGTRNIEADERDRTSHCNGNNGAILATSPLEWIHHSSRLKCCTYRKHHD